MKGHGHGPSHKPAHPHRSADHHGPAHPHEKPIHKSVIGAAFIFCFVGVVAFLGVHEPGTWTHLKTGEKILTERKLPQADPFSHTVGGRPWTTESWLGDVLFYRIHEGFSSRGLTVFKVLVAAAAFALLLPINPGQALLGGAVLCLGAAAAWPGFTELPSIFDLIMVALFIRILRPKTRFTWSLGWAAALEVLWANLHGATALIGVWMVALKVIRAAGRTDHRDLPKYLLVLGLTTAAWAANPYGWNLLPFPFVSGASAAPAPFWTVDVGLNLYILFLLAGAWAAWICLQTEFFLSLTTVTLLGLSFLFPGIRAMAILAACPTIALALGHFIPQRERRWSGVLKWLLIPVLILVWQWRYVHDPFKGLGYGAFDIDGAVHYLEAQGVRGRMFNDPELGDYLIGAGRPVFVDSRRGLYGRTFIRDAEAWPSRWKQLDQVFSFDYAVVRNTRSRSPARVLDDDPAWRLTFADDKTLVYLKRSGANDLLVQGMPRQLLRPNRLWPDGLDKPLKSPKWQGRLLEELDRWIVQSPDSLQALLWKAYALDRLNLAEKADRLLVLARRRDRLFSDAELSALYGFVLERRDRKADAQAAYWRAVRYARRLGDGTLESEVLLRLAGLHRAWGHASLAEELKARAESSAPERD